MPLPPRSRRRLVGVGLLACLALAFLFTWPESPRHFQPIASDLVRGAPVVVRGAYHVHTRRSDGSGTVDEVAAAAAEAGLRFVIFTDHGDGTRTPDPPAYRSGVLCLDGVEVSTDAGHYVALGLPATPWRLAGEPRDVVADVTRFGGLGIAAHPDSPKPELAWRAWREPIDGLEWMNLDTEWRDEPWWRLLASIGHYPFRPTPTVASLIGDGGGLLPRWAALARTRRTLGLGGVDAHARFGSEGGFREGGIGIQAPGYAVALAALQTGVELDEPLTGDGPRDGAALLAAIRAGRVHTVVAAKAAPGHIRFEAARGGRSMPAGAVLEGAGPTDFVAAAEAPQGSRVQLYCDGRRVADVAADRPLRHTVPDAAPVSSCQVVVGWAEGDRFVHWIVTNPIWLRSPGVDVPSAPAAPALSPVAAGLTAWRVEHDQASRAALSAAGEGIAMVYALGQGTRRGQYAAAVLGEVSTIAGASAVAITASADRPMRVSVQLREPLGGGEGRRWRRSVILTPESRQIVVPIAELQAIDAGPATPDLPRVHALLLVVDTVHTLPGATGTITVHGLAWGQGQGEGHGQ